MKLSQKDFEKRSFLEVLNTAVYKLTDDVHSKKKLYRYLFQLDGKIITDLRQIDPDCKVLLVSENRYFKGVTSQGRAISFQEFKMRDDK